MKENIDGKRCSIAVLVVQPKPAVRHFYGGSRGNEVDVFSVHDIVVLNHADSQVGVIDEQLLHQAVVVGRKVLHDYVSRVRLGRNVIKEALDRIQAPGRRTDANHKRGHGMVGSSSQVVGSCGVVR